MSAKKRPYITTDREVEMSQAIALARAKRNFSFRLFEALEAEKRGTERFLHWSKDGEQAHHATCS